MSESVTQWLENKSSSVPELSSLFSEIADNLDKKYAF
jgi:hypothetical protein